MRLHQRFGWGVKIGIVPIALSFVIGTALNLGVAWAISGDMVIKQDTGIAGWKRLPAGDWARYTVWREVGLERIRWDDFFDFQPESDAGPNLPAWSWVASRGTFNIPGSPRRGSAAARIETAVGWPLLSLRYCRTTWRIMVDGNSKITFEPSWSAILLQDHVTDPPHSQHKHRALPLIPLWPGFLFNALAYGAGVWLLWQALITLRAFGRYCRGLCPACAYPIGDSPRCAECGRSLPKWTSRGPADSPGNMGI